MSPLAHKYSTPGFIFARHGQSTSNFNGISSGGDTDPELTALGRRQAREIALALRRHVKLPNLIITSPLKRTMRTAQIISEILDIKIEIEESLIERALGDWNGQCSSITSKLLFEGCDPPNGEGAEQFRQRVITVFRSLSDHYKRWPLIIGSRGIARVLLDDTGYPDYRNMPNGTFVVVRLSSADEFEIAGIDSF